MRMLSRKLGWRICGGSIAARAACWKSAGDWIASARLLNVIQPEDLAVLSVVGTSNPWTDNHANASLTARCSSATRSIEYPEIPLEVSR